MASVAQIMANRANAQLSTGPRSEDGKARSAANSRRHGLTSRELVVRDDEHEEFDELVEALLEELDPTGELEQLTLEQLVHAAWTLRRCRRAEAELAAECDPLGPNEPNAEAVLRQQRIQRYAGQAERSYYRALKELKALQTHRGLQYVSGVTIPAVDENGVEQNEPVPVLADVKAIRNAGWLPPDAQAEAQAEAFREAERELLEISIRAREKHFKKMEARLRNEANAAAA